MEISSRTPEGFPSHCPLCGAETNLEFSDPGGDAPCPNCGHLLWLSTDILWVIRKLVAEKREVLPEQITPESTLANLGIDSLAAVELVMQLEEEFDLSIPESEAQQFKTIHDAIRYLIYRLEQERRKRREGE